MKTMIKAAIVGCMPVLLAASIPAQVVTVKDEAVTLNVSSAPDAEAQAVETDSFGIFGQTGDGMVLVRVGDTDGYVKKEELQAVLPTLNCDKYPLADGVTAVTPEDGEEAAKLLQTDLDELGVLSGEVDGMYGPGTSEAVRKIQEKYGLETTGNADLYTMLSIKGALEGLEPAIEVSSKIYTSAEEKFPEIVEKTGADLEAFMDAAYEYRFDEIEDSGEIDPAIRFGTFEVEAPEVDAISGDVSVKVLIRKNEQDSYDLIPALVVETKGAYRPYLQGVILGGDGSVKVEGGTSTGELDGVTLTETGYVPLTGEAGDYLMEGKLETIRVLGRNESYDVKAKYDADSLKAFLEACAELIVD